MTRCFSAIAWWFMLLAGLPAQDQKGGEFAHNPIIWADVPGVPVIRVGEPHFMGYPFALFNYATNVAGGFVDFDYLRVSDKITGANRERPTHNPSVHTLSLIISCSI